MATVEPNISGTLDSGSGPPDKIAAAEVKVKVKDDPLNPRISFDASEKTQKENKDADVVDIEGLKKIRETEIIKKGKVLLKLFRKKAKKQDETGVAILESPVPVSLSEKGEDEWEDEDNEDAAAFKTKKEHEIERAKRLFMLYQYYKKDRLSGIARVRAVWIQHMKAHSRTSNVKNKPFEAVGEPESSSSSYYTVGDSKDKINDANGKVSDMDDTQEVLVPEDTPPTTVNVEDGSFSGTESSTSSDDDGDLKSILDQFPTLQIPPSIVLSKDAGDTIEDDDVDIYDEGNQCNESWSSNGTQDGDLGDILDLFPIVPQFFTPNIKPINKDNGVKEVYKDSEEGRLDGVDTNADVHIVEELVASIEKDNDVKEVCKDSGEYEEKDEVEPTTLSNADVPIVEEQVVPKDADGTKLEDSENIIPKAWYERESGGDSKEDEDHVSESSSCSRFSTIDFKACDIYFPIPGIWLVVSDYDEDQIKAVDVSTMKEREGGFLEKDHELDTLTLNSGPCNYYFPVPRIWIRVSVYEDDLRKEEIMKDAKDVGENKEDVCVVKDAGTAIKERSREAFDQDTAPLKEYLLLDPSINADAGSSISSSRSFVSTHNAVNNDDDDEGSTTLSTIDILGLFPSIPPIVIIKTKPIENVDDAYKWDCVVCVSLAHGEATSVFDEYMWHNPWACGKGLETIRNECCAELGVKMIASVDDGLDDETTTSSHLSTSASSSTFDPDQTLKGYGTDDNGDDVISNVINGRKKLWFECDDANEKGECMSQSSSRSDFSTSDFQLFDVHFPIPDIWIMVSDYGADMLKSCKGGGGVDNGLEEKGDYFQTLALNCGPCNVYFPIPEIWIRVSVYEYDIHGVAVREKVIVKGQSCLEGLKRVLGEQKPRPRKLPVHDPDKTLKGDRVEHYATEILQSDSVVMHEAKKEEQQEEKAEENHPSSMALILRGSRQLQMIPRHTTHVGNVPEKQEEIISTLIINNEGHGENVNNAMALVVRGSRELNRTHRATDNPHDLERRRTLTFILARILEEEDDDGTVNSNLALIVRGPREVQRVPSRAIATNFYTVIKMTNNDIHLTEDELTNEANFVSWVYITPLSLPLSAPAPPHITPDAEFISEDEIAINFNFDLLLQLFAPYLAIIVVIFVASFIFIQGSGELSGTSTLQDMPGCFEPFDSHRSGSPLDPQL